MSSAPSSISPITPSMSTRSSSACSEARIRTPRVTPTPALLLIVIVIGALQVRADGLKVDIVDAAAAIAIAVKNVRHVAVAVLLLGDHEIALAIVRRLDRHVRRDVVIPVGLRVISRAVGVRREDRPELSPVSRGDAAAHGAPDSGRGNDHEPALGGIARIAFPADPAPAARTGADADICAGRYGQTQLGIARGTSPERKIGGGGALGRRGGTRGAGERHHGNK